MNDDMEESELANDVLDNSSQHQETGATRLGRKAGNKAKEYGKKGLKKAKEAKKAGKAAKGIGKILYPILVFILIIIMVIGIASFILNMPGDVSETIYKFVDDCLHEETLSIDDTIIVEILNYVDDMGIDPVGLGLIKGVTREDTDGDQNEEITGYTVNDFADFYLLWFAIADLRTNTTLDILNDLGNVWQEGDQDSFFEWVFTEEYPMARGMLQIDYGDNRDLLNNIKIDSENLTMTIENTEGILPKTYMYKYNIDGWSGRYGTPLELLLTVSTATMMPELAYEFASNPKLQTFVNILMKEVTLDVDLNLIKIDANGNETDSDLILRKSDNSENVSSFIENLDIVEIYNSENDEISIDNIDSIIEDVKSEGCSLEEIYYGTQNQIKADVLEEALKAYGDDSSASYHKIIFEEKSQEIIERQILDFINAEGPIYMMKPKSDNNGEYCDANFFLGGYIGTAENVEKNEFILPEGVTAKFTPYPGIGTTTGIITVTSEEEFVACLEDAQLNKEATFDVCKVPSIKQWIEEDYNALCGEYGYGAFGVDMQIKQYSDFNEIEPWWVVPECAHKPDETNYLLVNNKEYSVYSDTFYQIDTYLSFVCGAYKKQSADINNNAETTIDIYKIVMNVDVEDWQDIDEETWLFMNEANWQRLQQYRHNIFGSESLYKVYDGEMLKKECPFFIRFGLCMYHLAGADDVLMTGDEHGDLNAKAELEAMKNEINRIINLTSQYRKIRSGLTNEILKYYGMTEYELNYIYENFINGSDEEIVTFVPMITSVLGHWYKDIVFDYSYGDVEMEVQSAASESSTYKLSYTIKSKDEYPIQEGQPYVIKGDSVTVDGEETTFRETDYIDDDIDTFNSKNGLDTFDGNTSEENLYKLGEGYKVARKLFTQGYYYQYDGTEETANEIDLAKQIEQCDLYDQDEDNANWVRVGVKDGRLVSVTPQYVSSITYKDSVFGLVTEKNETIVNNFEGQSYAEPASLGEWYHEVGADGVDYYLIKSPGPYLSPALYSQDDVKNRVGLINETLKKLGTDIRRKPVSFSSGATALSAFSMLERMHSLDADYVYREFKEFILELGYYSRAELEQLETDKLDWFIPAYTPKEWPPETDDIMEYGVTLKAYSESVENEVKSADQVSDLNNFKFISSQTGIFNTTSLQEKGDCSVTQNPNGVYGNISSSENLKRTGLVLYYDLLEENVDGWNTSDDLQQLINGIQENLKKADEENGYNEDLLIYVLAILPSSPELSGGADLFNKEMYNYCLKNEKVIFINATEGLVDSYGNITTDNVSTTFTENIINEIIINKVGNGGFKEDSTVITPGAGYITEISEDEITIEFSVTLDPRLKPVDGFSMIIKGIDVDDILIQRYNNKIGDGLIVDEDGNIKLPIERGATIGVTKVDTDIKLILRDVNNGIIDNIEDYMPLNKNSAEITEWELLYFLPKESGAIDEDGCGVESVGVGKNKAGETTEVAVGIVQWTTNSSFNNVSDLCGRLAEKNASLCGGLETFASWSPDQVMADIDSETSQIREAFESIADTDRDTFLALQVECMLEDYSDVKGHDWLKERRGVVYGTYISACAWAGNYAGIDEVIDESMSDEELVRAMLAKAREKKGDDYRYNEGWDNRVSETCPDSQLLFALKILRGELDAEEIEQAVREGYSTVY